MASSYYVKLKDASSNVYYPLTIKGSNNYYFITGSASFGSSYYSGTISVGNFYAAYVYSMVSLTNGEIPITVFGASQTNQLIDGGYLPYTDCYGSDGQAGNRVLRLGFYKLYGSSSNATTGISSIVATTGQMYYLALVY